MTKRTTKTPKQKPVAVEWPADWAADEGWPSPDQQAPDGRTWGELDQELRKQGSSLEALMRMLGKPQ